MEHLAQMLIRFLVFVFDEALGKLVHEVGCHAHNFSLIHGLFDLAVVSLRILCDVPLEELILILHLHVVRGLRRRCPIRLGMLSLSELVALFDLGFLEKHSTDHAIFVEESLNLLRFDGE